MNDSHGLPKGIQLRINHRWFSLAEVSPMMTLLEFLRARGLVGTKEGCGDGDCGACTIVMLAKDAEGKPQYQAMNSCLIPLGSVAGREVITVEGLSEKTLHPVQKAMIKTAGSQCGYCTPGFIMSLFAAYYDGTLDDAAIEGNLCRCTGYVPIRQAAKSLGKPRASDGFLRKLNKGHESEASTQKLEAGGQVFYLPTKLTEVFDLLEQYPEARLVAGGTDLGLELSHKSKGFPVLIGLENIAQLKLIEETAEVLRIGAAVPLRHIETKWSGRFAALDEMLHWFAARQIRNRATLGGNLGTASPIGDLPPVLLALDASLRLASKAGMRELRLSEFFTAYRQTQRQANEVIHSLVIPKTLTQGAARRLSFAYKVGKRGTDDISIVAAAFTLDLDAANTIIHARLAYGGVATTPLRALELETWLIGKPWHEATVQAAKLRLLDAFSPIDDMRGSAMYRKRLAANLFEKFYHDFSESRP